MAFKNYNSPIPTKWVNLGGTNSKGEKNPTRITGYLVAVTTGPNKFNPEKVQTNFILQTPEGIVGVNGSGNLPNRAKDAMSNFISKENRSALGSQISIAFTGTRSTGKPQPMKCYSVEFDADDSIEVVVAAIEDDNTTNSSSSTTDHDSADQYDEEAEEAAQNEALAAAERKAKVDALLKRKRA